MKDILGVEGRVGGRDTRREGVYTEEIGKAARGTLEVGMGCVVFHVHEGQMKLLLYFWYIYCVQEK
jgi:hypothetical protein